MLSLRNPFVVDLRAIALMRMGIGALILADLLIRAPDLAVFLSDSGVWPRDVSMAYLGSERWSLYWISGHWLWSLLLFLCAGFFAICLLCGMRTRLATLMSFILLASLHNRAPLLLQGGDNLLLVLLFWGLFLPWGERFSFDAAMTREPRYQNRLFSAGGVALLLQIMSVYLFSAFLKNGAAWGSEGTGIYYALSNKQFTIGLASFWNDWLWLNKPLTHYVWWLELVGPLLAFSPLFFTQARLLVFFCFVTLEIGFLFNLSVGLFPFISIVSLLALLPTAALDRVFAPRRPASSSLVMYYDRDCGFCVKTCYWLAYLLGLNSVTSIHLAQDHPEVGPLLEREFSWVLETADGSRYLRWQAIVVLLQHSPRAAWLARPLSLLGGAGDRLYHWIGNHRRQFGRVTALALPWRERYPRHGWVLQGVAALFAGGILWWNISTIPQWDYIHGVHTGLPSSRVSYPETLRTVKNVLRLDQKWNMFAPYPDRSDDWYFIPGITVGGDMVDVLRQKDGMPDWGQPEDYYPRPAFLLDYRWRKYLTRIGYRSNSRYRGEYGSWVCRTWNESRRGEQRLEAFNIYLFRKPTPAPGATDEPPTRRIRLWRHHCLDADRLGEDRVEKRLAQESGW